MLAFKDKSPSPGKLFVYGITLYVVTGMFIGLTQNIHDSFLFQLKTVIWIILAGNSIYLIVLSIVRKVKLIKQRKQHKSGSN